MNKLDSKKCKEVSYETSFFCFLSLFILKDKKISMEEKKYLDKAGLEEVFKLLITLIDTKLDSDRLVPLTIDEYNDLGSNIDLDSFYFIIDKDDDIFDKIQEINDAIDLVKADVEIVKEFKESFPIDNHTYGIINQQPKNLSEVFSELAIPGDPNYRGGSGNTGDGDDNSSENPELNEDDKSTNGDLEDNPVEEEEKENMSDEN